MRLIAYTSGLAALIFLVAYAPPAVAVTETVLWEFHTPKDGWPQGRLLFWKGSLIGAGTSYNNGTQRNRNGSVFKLTPSGGSWNHKLVFVFDYANGANPHGGLTLGPNESLYGTTLRGGVYDHGNVFQLHRSGGVWSEQAIWSFGSIANDGEQPWAELIADRSGALYGTTGYGGAYGEGTAFKLSYSKGSWKETILHSFGAGGGSVPQAGLLRGSDGTLYGTTAYRNGGTVFALSHANGAWSETVLHNFTGGSDGGYPHGTLIRDSQGNLYGTTASGGLNDNGTVFELTNFGGAWTETVLYSFGVGSDGGYPLAGLSWGPNGSLYGTTPYGGTNGHGTVFTLTNSGGVWQESVLRSFGGRGDGANPAGAVIFDENGNLYGTTESGGDLSCAPFYGCGTVWKITP